MLTIRYMVSQITSGDIPDPEIYGLQYAMYLGKDEWYPNSAGNDLDLDRQGKCKYILNKAKMSGAVTMLTPWSPVRTEANFLIHAYKKKKKVNAFLRMDCYYSDRDDITFGSARSGNFEFKGFAGMFLDGFKVTQYSVLGTQIVKHGTAEVFTLASDRMETY